MLAWRNCAAWPWDPHSLHFAVIVLRQWLENWQVNARGEQASIRRRPCAPNARAIQGWCHIEQESTFFSTQRKQDRCEVRQKMQLSEKRWKSKVVWRGKREKGKKEKERNRAIEINSRISRLTYLLTYRPLFIFWPHGPFPKLPMHEMHQMHQIHWLRNSKLCAREALVKSHPCNGYIWF